MGVSWIKLSTDMFDNRKIKYLRKLPEGNSIVLIWVMLLTLAGRCNAGGMIFLTENIPYDSKALADELGFDENVINLALSQLIKLGMISTDSFDFIEITGWEDHQNIDGLEKIRESKKMAQARWRAKQKALPVDSTVDSTEISPSISVDDADKNRIDKKRIDKNKNKYGEYKNVELTEEEFERLGTEFGNAKRDSAIKFLDEYITEKGYKSKSHNLAIRRWVLDAIDEQNKKHPNKYKVEEVSVPKELPSSIRR